MLVALGEGYTAAEQTLFEAGKWHEVRRARQQWQDTMQVRFVQTIERLTRRNVSAFMSANHQDPDLSVENLRARRGTRRLKREVEMTRAWGEAYHRFQEEVQNEHRTYRSR